MKNRLVVAASAAALSVALLGAAPAFAQSNSGGTITIGGDIADTVASAVSGIATHSGSSSATGGVSSEHNELSFGEQEGLAVSDASGGNRNASANE